MARHHADLHGQWTSPYTAEKLEGRRAGGLKEGAVDYALDRHNAKLIPTPPSGQSDAVRPTSCPADQVADYMADSACKY